MMGIVVPETCWAYKKYNKIISGNYLVDILLIFDFRSEKLSELINPLCGQNVQFFNFNQLVHKLTCRSEIIGLM